MIEAFYSGTAGLTAHQNSLDVLSNNVANVNTDGYKTKVQDFSSLLSTSEVRSETANSANLLAGSGSAVSSVATDMSQGESELTGTSTDYYIDGSGFFAVRDKAGNTYYTRDGSFQKTAGTNGEVLSTADGSTVLDASGNAVKVDSSGTATTSPGIYTFSNAPGLLSVGGNLFEATNLSGAASASTAKPVEGMLERSNVSITEQMAGLITSQRGYQFNSSVVSTANQIETMVNELGQ
jgi:flagellar basal-body rod protein FlgG